MAHSLSKALADTQVARIDARRHERGITRRQLFELFERSLQGEHRRETAKIRFDRVFNARMRRPVTEETKAALAKALGWTPQEFDAEVFQIKPASGTSRNGQIGKKNRRAESSIRQIAFAALVQLETHQIAREVDLSEDNLMKVYDAAHRLFLKIRDLIGEMPVDEFAQGPEAQLVYATLTGVLNDGLRPHLTKWPERYDDWRKRFAKTATAQKFSPQQMQRRFPQRRTLERELKEVAKRLQADLRILKSVIFAGNGGKK